MTEYWINVYRDLPLEVSTRFGDKELAIRNGGFREIVWADKCLYRIHVKLKPKPKPKFERYVTDKNFNWMD